MIKSILLIDKNPVLISFSQSFLGKCVSLVIFCLPLFFLMPPSWGRIAFVLSFFIFYPSGRWIFLILANIYFWVFSLNLYWTILQPVYVSSQLDGSLLNSFLFRACMIFATFFICWILVRILRKKIFQKYAFFYLIFLYLSLSYVVSLFFSEGILYAILCTVLFLVGRFFWFLLYAITDYDEKDGVFPHLLVLQPFFAPGSILPIPGGLTELKKTEAIGVESYALCRLKAIKLIYSVGFLYLLLMVFNQLLVGYPNFKQVLSSQLFPPSGLNLETFLQNLPSLDLLDKKSCLNCTPSEMVEKRFFPANNLSEYLVNLTVQLLYAFNNVFLILFVWNTTIVAVARMAGFYVNRPTNRPMKASSLPDFLARLAHYYVLLIKKFIFIPLVSFFNFIGSSRLRVYSALFSSIIICGLTFQFILKTQLEFFFLKQKGMGEALKILVLNFLPHYMFLVVAIFFSEVLRYFFKARIPTVVRITSYLLVFFIGTSYAFRVEHTSIGEFLVWLKELFIPFL